MREVCKGIEKRSISAGAICPFFAFFVHSSETNTRSHRTQADSTAAQLSALWQEGVMTHALPVLCSEALHDAGDQSALPRDPKKINH